MLEHAPELVQHRRLLYETDSQTGFHSVMRMKGNASTFPVVKELRLLCAAEDVEIDVVWKPREHANQQVGVWDNNSLSNTCKLACASVLQCFRMHAKKSSACLHLADQWSKVEDNFEWMLHEEVFQELYKTQCSRVASLLWMSLLAALPRCQRPFHQISLPRNEGGGCNGATMGLERSGRKQAVGVHQWSFPTHGPSCQEN